MQHVLTALILAFSIGGAASANEVEWRDSASGTRFKILSEKMGIKEAVAACEADGWDLFNYEYLSSEEQQRFLAAEQLRQLPWEKKFQGKPAEHEIAQVWMSTEAHGVRAVLSIRQTTPEAKRRAALRWGADEPLPVVCMFQSLPWVRCRVTVQCKDSGPKAFPGLMMWWINEEGPTKRVAIQRAKDRLKVIPPTYLPCEVDDSHPYCETVRQ